MAIRLSSVTCVDSHQSLAAVIVHPDQKTVLPLDFEPIVKGDGKNQE